MLMENPKLSVERVTILWKSLSIAEKSSLINTILQISIYLGYDPISITLLTQQSDDEFVRQASIQAYFYVMEEEMLQQSLKLSIIRF